VPVIRWGPNTSSDKLRQCARCTACGHKERDAGSIPVVLILASYRFRRTCSVLQVVSKPKAVKQIRRGDAQNPTVNRRNQKRAPLADRRRPKGRWTVAVKHRMDQRGAGLVFLSPESGSRQFGKRQGSSPVGMENARRALRGDSHGSRHAIRNARGCGQR
jgi:hypothetical protein